MIIRMGNFLFHYRNVIFPLFYLILFIPSRGIFSNPQIAMLIGFAVLILGQLIRVITIGLVYIVREGKYKRFYGEELVTTGIFSHCRNPLYMGNILILAGLGIASNSIIFNSLVTPLFLFFWQAIVMAEENYLRNKFGKQYEAYCKRVNRWLPDLKGINTTISSMKFKWKRVIIREYTAIYIWMIGAVLIIMKHFYLHNNQFDFSKYRSIFITALFVLSVLYLFTFFLKKSRIIRSH